MSSTFIHVVACNRSSLSLTELFFIWIPWACLATKLRKVLQIISLVDSKLKCIFLSWERERLWQIERKSAKKQKKLKLGGLKENAEAASTELTFFSICTGKLIWTLFSTSSFQVHIRHRAFQIYCLVWKWTETVTASLSNLLSPNFMKTSRFFY